MSHPLLRDDVLHRQRLFRAAGLYDGALDGIWGPQTDAAVGAWERAHDDASPLLVFYDARSNQLMRSLLPVAHRQAALCISALLKAGLRPRVISGTRSYVEQDALYRVGRRGVAGERIVTNARGGQSLHNFGLSWDLGLFTVEGKYLPEDRAYDHLGMYWKPPGIEWGGDWNTPDRPHYQLATGLKTAALRAAFEAGTLRMPL